VRSPAIEPDKLSISSVIDKSAPILIRVCSAVEATEP
jgi:hypothetical protein